MPLRRTYLDHVASAPLLSEAREEMLAALDRAAGNPSSPHAEGRLAKDLLEEARSRTAAVLGCRPREVVFTGSGTEALQIALLGAARARKAVAKRVVVSAVEHPAVLEGADLLGADGFEVVRVPPAPDGRVPAAAFLAACEPAAVAALMLANHETGAIQPVAEVAAALKARGVPLVCDAALAPGRLTLGADAVGAPLIALSGHKFGGPKGIGALVVRRGTRLDPPERGGPQEERLRPGTENVAAAIGLARALEGSTRAAPERAARYDRLLGRFLASLGDLAGCRRLGPSSGGLAGVATFEIAGVEGEAAMIQLDLQGFAISTGSTCALGGSDPSPGLLALGLDARRAASTVRVSFGEGVSDEEASAAGAALAKTASRLRALARG